MFLIQITMAVVILCQLLSVNDNILIPDYLFYTNHICFLYTLLFSWYFLSHVYTIFPLPDLLTIQEVWNLSVNPCLRFLFLWNKLVSLQEGHAFRLKALFRLDPLIESLMLQLITWQEDTLYSGYTCLLFVTKVNELFDWYWGRRLEEVHCD